MLIALIAMAFIVLTILIRGPLSDAALKGAQEGALTFIEPRVFEAIGVISFAVRTLQYPCRGEI